MRQVETGQMQPPVLPSSEQNLGEMWICSLAEVAWVIFSGSGPTKQILGTAAPAVLILCVCVCTCAWCVHVCECVYVVCTCVHVWCMCVHVYMDVCCTHV